MLISPELYRRMIKPRHATLNDAIRSGTRASILYHSCGAVMPVIEDLIEVRVSILNPIQSLPGLMEPEELAERYGDRLVFHGGLDVQRLLPSGSRRETEDHVARYYRALNAERYIMAPANSVQVGTPPANLVAAFDRASCY